MKPAHWCVALALALPACGGDSSAPDVVPSPVTVASPSPVPSPVPTPSPVPSPDPSPTPDPGPTPTPNPTPHPTPPPPPPTQPTPPPTPLPDVIVNINGQAFSPPSVSVTVGQKVIWKNNDVVQHTATATNGAFDTGPIPPGSQASVTMTSAGTFNYVCVFHPMTGTVNVSP